jgi:hypothetical protein
MIVLNLLFLWYAYYQYSLITNTLTFLAKSKIVKWYKGCPLSEKAVEICLKPIFKPKISSMKNWASWLMFCNFVNTILAIVGYFVDGAAYGSYVTGSKPL